MSVDTSRPASATFINPPGLVDPTAFHYSHVAVTEPGARLVLIAGQGGHVPDKALPPAFEDQARQVFKNIIIALDSVGARIEDVLRLTIFIVDYDMERLAAYHAAQYEAFGDHRPVGSLIPVPQLGAPDMLLEVEATAALPG